MLLQHGTIDAWMTGPLPKVTNLLIFNENEHGHAGYAAMKAIVGDSKPLGYITSHLIGNILFNQSIEPSNIGWEVYIVGDCAVLLINEWPTVPLFPIEESKGLWINCYPVVRDTLRFFQQHGANAIHYFTATVVHEMLDNDQFAMQDTDARHDVVFREGQMDSIHEGDVFFTPPAWMFPHFASLLGYRNATTSLFGYDADKSVNDLVAMTMTRHIYDWYALVAHQENFDTACEEMRSLNERADNIRAEMEELIKGKPANSTMWG